MEMAVQDGRITQERLQQSLARVARLKARYLLPYKPVTISEARLTVGCRSHALVLNAWHNAYGRMPKPRMTEGIEPAPTPDSPVTHV